MPSRRTILRGLAATPLAAIVPAAKAATIAIQPSPALTAVRCLDGYSAVTRVWANGDHRRCLLCDRCDAVQGTSGAICTVIVDRPVTVDDGALYSTRGYEVPG